MPDPHQEAAEHILPLYINGLNGRMLRAPSTSRQRREILLIYGHHAMLERWWGLVQNLQTYGNVTMPDIPGFGGMESLYKIDSRPSIDAFADYLAAFIKLRYSKKRLSIFAVSYGFVVVTRMLQRYPELTKKVDILVSIAGFMHRDDLVFSTRKRLLYRSVSRLFATRPVAITIRYAGLNKFVIRFLSSRFANSKRRMIDVSPEEIDKTMDFEVKLWQANDVRTHWLTTYEMLGLDNCSATVEIPVIHVISKEDHYINNITAEQHMRQVFSGYTQFVAKSKAHVPNVLANKRDMSVLVPPGLRRLLSNKTKPKN